jgi:hypothetical protein
MVTQEEINTAAQAYVEAYKAWDKATMNQNTRELYLAMIRLREELHDLAELRNTGK